MDGKATALATLPATSGGEQNGLARYPEPASSPITAMAPGITADELKELETFCTHLARSGYFKDASQVSQAIVKVLMGRELGLAPMASMTKIYIIEGKPAVGADLLARMIKLSGKYNYRIVEHTADKCRIEFLERIDGQWQTVGESEFTMAEAQKAQLHNKNNWKNYPKNMLFARALSNGQKWFCPDATAVGVYTQEEMEDAEDVRVNEQYREWQATQVRERPRTQLSQRQLDKQSEAEKGEEPAAEIKQPVADAKATETAAQEPEKPAEAQQRSRTAKDATKPEAPAQTAPAVNGDPAIKQAKNEIAEMFTKATGLSWKDRADDFKLWAQKMLGTDKPTRDFSLDDYREIVGRANQISALWGAAFDKFDGNTDDLIQWLGKRGLHVTDLRVVTQPEWLRINEMLDTANGGEQPQEDAAEETEPVYDAELVLETPGKTDPFAKDEGERP